MEKKIDTIVYTREETGWKIILGDMTIYIPHTLSRGNRRNLEKYFGIKVTYEE